MKKFLSLLGIFSLVGSSTTMVIACGTPTNEIIPDEDQHQDEKLLKVDQLALDLVTKYSQALTIADQFNFSQQGVFETLIPNQKDQEHLEKFFNVLSTEQLQLNSSTVGASGGILNDLVPPDFNLDKIIRGQLPENLQPIIDDVYQLIDENILTKLFGPNAMKAEEIFSKNGPEQIEIFLQIANRLFEVGQSSGLAPFLEFLPNFGKMDFDLLKFFTTTTGFYWDAIKPFWDGIAKGSDGLRFDKKLTVAQLQPAIIGAVINALGFALEDNYAAIDAIEKATNPDSALKAAASKLVEWINSGAIKNLDFTSQTAKNNLPKILENFALAASALNIMLTLYRTQDVSMYESTYNDELILQVTVLTDQELIDQGYYASIQTKSFNRLISKQDYNRLLNDKVRLFDVTKDANNKSKVNDLEIYGLVLNSTDDETTKEIFGWIVTNKERIPLDEFRFEVIGQIIQSNVSRDLWVNGKDSMINGEIVFALESENKGSWIRPRWEYRAITAVKDEQKITYKVYIITDKEFNLVKKDHIELNNQKPKLSNWEPDNVSKKIMQQTLTDGNHLFSEMKTNPEYLGSFNNKLIADFSTLDATNPNKQMVHTNLQGFNLNELLANIQYYLGGSKLNYQKLTYILFSGWKDEVNSYFVQFGIDILMKKFNIPDLFGVVSGKINGLASLPLMGIANNQRLHLTGSGGVLDNFWYKDVARSFIKKSLPEGKLEEVEKVIADVDHFFGDHTFDVLYEGNLMNVFPIIAPLISNQEGFENVQEQIEILLNGYDLNLESLMSKLSLDDYLHFFKVPGFEKINSGVPTNNLGSFTSKTGTELINWLAELFNTEFGTSSKRLQNNYFNLTKVSKLLSEFFSINQNSTTFEEFFLGLGFTNLTGDEIKTESFLGELLQSFVPDLPINEDSQTIIVSSLTNSLQNRLTWFIEGINNVCQTLFGIAPQVVNFLGNILIANAITIEEVPYVKPTDLDFEIKVTFHKNRVKNLGEEAVLEPTKINYVYYLHREPYEKQFRFVKVTKTKI